MVTVTILLTAPSESEGFVHLDEWMDAARAHRESVEFLLADARVVVADDVPPRVRRIAMPGGSVQGLIDEGLRQARGTWVLLSEDHCRPLPGLLEAYQRTMRDHPDADLFAGGVENLTSISPWSFANFLSGLTHVWPRARGKPPDASNANLLVRRDAIPSDEIAVDGGFLARTIPRLIEQGRHVECADARIDHIVHVTGPRQGVPLQHRIVTAAIVSRRQVLPPRHPIVQLLRDLAAVPYYIAAWPWQITWHLRGTPQWSLGTVFRLAVLGTGIGIVPLQVDLRRRFRRERPAAGA